MTIETELQRALESAGSALPDGEGGLADVMRRGCRRRHRRHAGVVGAVVAGAVVVAGVTFPLGTPTVVPVLGGGAAGDVEVAIFLCDHRSPVADESPCPGPVTDGQRDGLRAALDADRSVASYRYESPDEAYARFSELFADEPELVDSVTADVLPASFRVSVIEEADPQAVVARFKAMPGVEEAVLQERGWTRPGEGPETP